MEHIQLTFLQFFFFSIFEIVCRIEQKKISILPILSFTFTLGTVSYRSSIFFQFVVQLHPSPECTYVYILIIHLYTCSIQVGIVTIVAALHFMFVYVCAAILYTKIYLHAEKHKCLVITCLINYSISNLKRINQIKLKVLLETS